MQCLNVCCAFAPCGIFSQWEIWFIKLCLNDAETAGSIGRDSKRLVLAVSWPCMRRYGATKMSTSMLSEHNCSCDMNGDLSSPCATSVALLIQVLLQVQHHLPKLFDSLAHIKFQLDSEQKVTKVGLGMYSREEEYVNFSEPCDCSGQVRGKPLSIRAISGVCSPALVWASPAKTLQASLLFLYA